MGINFDYAKIVLKKLKIEIKIWKGFMLRYVNEIFY
jgi:hypothetical protein